ncbi:hypothetical protein COCVIDRAFT_12395 [Bipolaris victoriae FI3]|uniref:Uncharacterized protein n=1 Tax=Bipolaris victoriae (strain FI3) TaxID=930091 RepID=W7EZT9_BIPV3|nr:hypothetical protein COCVIDRAFT_12395 [Bipolaris victoriae FI3]
MQQEVPPWQGRSKVRGTWTAALSRPCFNLRRTTKVPSSADLDAAQKKNGHRYSWRADNKRATTPMLAPLQGAGGASVLRFNLRTPAGATHEKRGQAQFGKTSSLIPDLRGMASKGSGVVNARKPAKLPASCPPPPFGHIAEAR